MSQSAIGSEVEGVLSLDWHCPISQARKASINLGPNLGLARGKLAHHKKPHESVGQHREHTSCFVRLTGQLSFGTPLAIMRAKTKG